MKLQHKNQVHRVDDGSNEEGQYGSVRLGNFLFMMYINVKIGSYSLKPLGSSAGPIQGTRSEQHLIYSQIWMLM